MSQEALEELLAKAKQAREIRNHQEALNLYEKIIDAPMVKTSVLSEAYQGRGLANIARKRYRQAIQDLESAKLLAHEADDLRRYFNIDRDLAEAYRKSGQPDKAGSLLIKTERLQREHGFLADAAATLGFRGRVEIDRGNYAEAEKLLKAAGAQLRNSDEQHWYLYTLLPLARALWLQNERVPARITLQHTHRFATELGDKKLALAARVAERFGFRALDMLTRIISR